MHLIIGLVLVVLLLTSHVLRLILVWVVGFVGAGGLLLFGIFVWSMFTQPPATQVERSSLRTAADYRAAQAAIARATGRPCDYACKELLADQARPPRID